LTPLQQFVRSTTSLSLDELNSASRRFAELLLPNIRELIPNFTPVFQNEAESGWKQKSERKRALARSSLKVTPEITPSIDSIVADVCTRLSLSRGSLDVYIFPSTDLNAFCYVDDLPVTVGLSSNLVKTLDRDELAFVIGHEVGHVFFKEIGNFSPSLECLEDLIIARSVELTVDRIGLVASGKIEGSFGAILKTLSGLDDKYLRYDFSKLLGESREILADASADVLIHSTHPPLALRFKALVSFSTSNEFFGLVGEKRSVGVSLNRANKLILKSLARAVDSYAQSEIESKLNDIGMWVACLLLLRKKTLSLSVLREIFSIRLTKEEIEKSVIYVTGYSKELIPLIMQEQLFKALVNGYEVAPRRTYAALVGFVQEYPGFKVLLNPPDFFRSSLKVTEIIV